MYGYAVSCKGKSLFSIILLQSGNEVNQHFDDLSEKAGKRQTKSSSAGNPKIENEPSMVKIMVMGYDHVCAFNILLQIHDQNQAVRESVTALSK